MSRVYDCFTYFNEDRLLDLRLRTLSDVVDVFVVVEATHSFTGQPKSLEFDLDRHSDFANRIRHVVVDNLHPDPSQSWVNERMQRNAIVRGLDDAKDDDRIIVSDLDEIPHPDAIGQYRSTKLLGTFVQRWFNYRLNNVLVDPENEEREIFGVNRSRITTNRHLRRFFRTPQRLRCVDRSEGPFVHWHRLWRKIGEQRLEPGGWHFSWVMSPEEMILKIESFAHTEVNRPEFKSIEGIQAAMQAGRDILGKNERFRLVEIDESFPAPLHEAPERYRNMWTPVADPS